MKLSDLDKKGVSYQIGGVQRGGSTVPQQQQEYSAAREAAQPFIGGAKGALSTVRGAVDLVRKIPIVGPALTKLSGITDEQSKRVAEAATPTTTGQKIGFGAEQLAEFLIPGGAVSKGTKAVEAAADAAKLSKVASFTAKVGTRAVLEGTSAGAVRAAQTGDAGSGAKAGVGAGVITAVLGAAGAALRATGIPEKLYSQIFKNSVDDMTEALKTGALQDLQQRFPEKFKELVDQGIIKVGANGTVKYNPTLAREALDHGLKGSITNMSNEVVRKTLDLEQAARQIAEAYTQPIKIAEKDKYMNLLKQIQKQYKGTFLEGRAQQAEQFIQALKPGQTDATTALNLRRFLDRMRVASSYRPATHLSIGQEDFKAASDQLRGVLNSIPGMKDVMSNYRFYIEALSSLGKEAAKRKNAAVINLIDTALFGFGGGLAGPEGAAALPLVRRALTVPSVVTNVGTKVEEGTQGAAGRVIRGAVGTAITPGQ